MEVMHGHQHLKVFRQSDEVAQLLKSQPEIQELMSGPDGDGHFDHWFNQTGGRSKAGDSPMGGMQLFQSKQRNHASQKSTAAVGEPLVLMGLAHLQWPHMCPDFFLPLLCSVERLCGWSLLAFLQLPQGQEPQGF